MYFACVRACVRACERAVVVNGNADFPKHIINLLAGADYECDRRKT